jgi:PAS domain S-box-containing protein
VSSLEDEAGITAAGEISHAHAFLREGGEMGARMRAYDWAATPLGDPDGWPETLQTMVPVILNSALLGTILWGPELRLIYNDAYAPALADRHPMALGRPIADVWGPVWDQIAPQFLPVMENGEPIFDRKLPLTIERDGRNELTYWTYSVSPIRDPDGRIVGLLNQAIEITGEVRAEQDRAEAEERLKELNRTLEDQIVARTADRNRMWQMSTDVMLVTDMEGVIEAINPAWTHLLGWSEVDLVGKPFLDYVHPDDIESSLAVVAGIGVGEQFAYYNNRYRHKDGSYRDILWTAGPGDGKMLGVGRDATEQRARERALAEAEDALRQSQKMEAVGQLTGGLAHDLTICSPALWAI